MFQTMLHVRILFLKYVNKNDLIEYAESETIFGLRKLQPYSDDEPQGLG